MYYDPRRPGQDLLDSLLTPRQLYALVMKGRFRQGRWVFDHYGRVLHVGSRFSRCVAAAGHSRRGHTVGTADKTASMLLLLRSNPKKFRDIVRHRAH